jgi:hypothetical protein
MTTAVTEAFRLTTYAAAKRQRPERRPRRARPSVTRIPRAVLAEAERLAGGDLSRLRFLPDGSVIVANRPASDAPRCARCHARPRLDDRLTCARCAALDPAKRYAGTRPHAVSGGLPTLGRHR